jgi:TolA-binding protein
VTLLVAAAFVLGFAAAAIAARLSLRQSTVQAPSVPAAVTPAQADALEPSGPKAEVPAGTPSEAVTEVPERPSVGPKPRQASAADVNDADALELALLQQARGAVARGEFSTALDALLTHQRRFPAGRLREEREALRIKALAGLGRNDEAQRAAERFRERFPRSVLSDRIEETVRPRP